MAKNYKDILNEGVALPLAIESKLPAGAPKISSWLNKLTAKLPNAPNAPFTFPDLPPIPTLPTIGKAGLPKQRQEATTIRLVDTVITPPRTSAQTPGGGTAVFMQNQPGPSTVTFK